MDYIDSHLFGKIDLDLLSHLACYSPHYFENVFGQHVGSTPIDYVRRRRIQYAASRLRHERSSIGELGMQAGFAHYHAFAKAFHRNYGMAAGEWRHEAGWRDHMTGTISRNGPRMPSALDFKLNGIATKEPEDIQQRVAQTTQVVFLPATPVLSKRVVGAWKDSAMTIAMAQFMTELKLQHAFGMNANYIGLFYGDPGMISSADFIFEACATLPSDFPLIKQQKTIPGGYYAQFVYQAGHPLFRRLYEDWLELQDSWQLDSARPHLRCFPQLNRPGWIALPVQHRGGA
ncbi:helix-turn-helix domain-containing protein [Andreprevotia chitinilytica]|uniref:helix-turn-helix domain-containing protein n=1 Tax=Andreprevotia chitinilytica TaxID=396808 RepID=UPI0005531A61|nr:helix-turn-helix domain-containing protein [Andreprevotia chitinilytica]